MGTTTLQSTLPLITWNSMTKECQGYQGSNQLTTITDPLSIRGYAIGCQSSQDGGRSARCGQCLCNDPNSPCPNGRVPGKITLSKRSAKMYLESSQRNLTVLAEHISFDTLEAFSADQLE